MFVLALVREAWGRCGSSSVSGRMLRGLCVPDPALHALSCFACPTPLCAPNPALHTRSRFARPIQLCAPDPALRSHAQNARNGAVAVQSRDRAEGRGSSWRARVPHRRRLLGGCCDVSFCCSTPSTCDTRCHDVPAAGPSVRLSGVPDTAAHSYQRVSSETAQSTSEQDLCHWF